MLYRIEAQHNTEGSLIAYRTSPDDVYAILDVSFGVDNELIKILGEFKDNLQKYLAAYGTNAAGTTFYYSTWHSGFLNKKRESSTYPHPLNCSKFTFQVHVEFVDIDSLTTTTR